MSQTFPISQQSNELSADSQEGEENAFGRYAVFSGIYYYPEGGWADFIDFCENKEKAILKANECIEKDCNDWAQVIDLRDGGEVYGSLDSNVARERRRKKSKERKANA